MIIQIQQTSLVVIGFAILLIWFDQRHIDRIPYWYVATVLTPAFIAVAALIITTIIRIWS